MYLGLQITGIWKLSATNFALELLQFLQTFLGMVSDPGLQSVVHLGGAPHDPVPCPIVSQIFFQEKIKFARFFFSRKFFFSSKIANFFLRKPDFFFFKKKIKFSKIANFFLDFFLIFFFLKKIFFLFFPKILASSSGSFPKNSTRNLPDFFSRKK